MYFRSRWVGCTKQLHAESHVEWMSYTAHTLAPDVICSTNKSQPASTAT